MSKDNLLFTLLGVIVGGLIVALLVFVPSLRTGSAWGWSMMGQDPYGYGRGMMGGWWDRDETAGMRWGMTNMMQGIYGKTGDDFDRAFLATMILHHQAAVTMAQEALQNAKHPELKQLANDIITNQTKEINEMKGWQTSWGYTK